MMLYRVPLTLGLAIEFNLASYNVSKVVELVGSVNLLLLADEKCDGIRITAPAECELI